MAKNDCQAAGDSGLQPFKRPPCSQKSFQPETVAVSAVSSFANTDLASPSKSLGAFAAQAARVAIYLEAERSELKEEWNWDDEQAAASPMQRSTSRSDMLEVFAGSGSRHGVLARAPMDEQ